MLKGYVAGDAEVAARFSRMPARFQDALRVGITRATLTVLRYAKDNVNGHLVNVRTGRLRRSITYRVTDQPGRVEGIVGTKVEYAHRIEYGFTGNETVREHLRRMKSGNEVTVRSHTRRANSPERAPLRNALKTAGPDIADEIQRSIQKYWSAL